MFERLDKCPLCNSEDLKNEILCKDHTVSQQDFAIAKCTRCDFMFTSPRPTAKSLPDYYKSEDYISHKNKSNNPVNFIYKIARHFTIKSKIKLINKYGKKGAILDIGCGTGHFLNACKQDGWGIYGVEPDNSAKEIAREKTNTVIKQDVNELTDKKFDVITLWHVLEHISNLNEFITSISERLTKNGVIIVAVPNHRSYDAQHYKQFWAAYDLPRHLYHFEQKTMKALMKNHKLKITAIIPMKLDAYYVSLLSESNQNIGIKKYLNSILTGWKSNKYAKNNAKNYSSLIYIISR